MDQDRPQAGASRHRESIAAIVWHRNRCDLHRAQPSLVVGHRWHLCLVQGRQFRKIVRQPWPVRRIEREQDDPTACYAAHLAPSLLSRSPKPPIVAVLNIGCPRTAPVGLLFRPSLAPGVSACIVFLYNRRGRVPPVQGGALPMESRRSVSYGDTGGRRRRLQPPHGRGRGGYATRSCRSCNVSSWGTRDRPTPRAHRQARPVTERWSSSRASLRPCAMLPRLNAPWRNAMPRHRREKVSNSGSASTSATSSLRRGHFRRRRQHRGAA